MNVYVKVALAVVAAIACIALSVFWRFWLCDGSIHLLACVLFR